MASERVMGVGVLGFGFMGRTHTYAHKAIPFYYDPPPVKCRMVAVCRANASLLDRARVMGGFDRCTTDPLEVIDDKEVDIVHICTPNSEHMPALRAAIAAGKHVYVDKPVTASLSEAEELAGLLDDYEGVALSLIHI